MCRSSRRALILFLLAPLAILSCSLLSRFTMSEHEEYWEGMSFTGRWSAPIPGGPLNFDGTISGCANAGDISATARVHGPLGGGGDVDMKGKYPAAEEDFVAVEPDLGDADTVPLVPLVPSGAQAVGMQFRTYEFDLPLNGEVTGLNCPCKLGQTVHFRVEIDLATRNAWIRQARAPTGVGSCSCRAGQLLASIVPTSYPSDIIIELVPVEDPNCTSAK